MSSRSRAQPARHLRRRLFVSGDLAAGKRFSTTPAQHHYLAHVLRAQKGDCVLVFNGRDGEWGAEIGALDRRTSVLVVRAQQRPQSGGPDIDYLFAPLKRARLDYMVQKATELGAARLRPVLTAHTDAPRLNMARLRANIIEAAEQCGVLRVPELKAPMALAELLASWQPARRLIFCDEAAPVADPIAALGRLAPGPLALLIGPEGGFSAEERAALLACQFVTAISLGPRIMRADTAGVAAMALIQATLGDWRGNADDDAPKLRARS